MTIPMIKVIKDKDYLSEVYAKTRPLFFFCDNLKERWQDEREYEDFKDYIEEAKKRFEKIGFKLVKMTKSFNLEFITPEEVTIYAKVKKASNSLSYVKR